MVGDAGDLTGPEQSDFTEAIDVDELARLRAKNVELNAAVSTLMQETADLRAELAECKLDLLADATALDECRRELEECQRERDALAEVVRALMYGIVSSGSDAVWDALAKPIEEAKAALAALDDKEVVHG